MSKELQDLLLLIRQHAAFPLLLKAMDEQNPETKTFKLSQPTQDQLSEWIFRSGRRAQHEAWRSFLTGTQE